MLPHFKNIIYYSIDTEFSCLLSASVHGFLLQDLTVTNATTVTVTTCVEDACGTDANRMTATISVD